MTTPIPTYAVGDAPTAAAWDAIAAAINSRTVWQASAHATVSIATGGTPSLITLDTILYDSASLGITSGGVQVTAAGSYLVSGFVGFAANATGRRGGSVYHGATQGATPLTPATAASVWQGPLPATIVVCAAGDVLTLHGYQDSGGALSTIADACLLTVVKL